MIAPGKRDFWTLETIRLFAEKAKNTHYQFALLPEHPFRNMGVYIHVPFCSTICRFCPYYREVYNSEKKSLYIEALLREISKREMEGNPRWIYIGGGTPNTLSIQDWDRVFQTLSGRIQVQNIGMELAPSSLTESYLRNLAKLGVRKISLGVESFSLNTLKRENRPGLAVQKIKKLVHNAQDLGLWVNTDIMLGFEGQKLTTFWQDMEHFLNICPQQITLYPLMTIRGTPLQPVTLADQVQFDMIEQAGQRLESAGYIRRTLWTWSRGEELYDSSYDEMGSEYIGLGASAISSTHDWVAVNLPLEGYLQSWSGSYPPHAFVNAHLKQKVQEGWRRFGMMLYERRLYTLRGLPEYINLFITALKWSGYSRKGRLTVKGINFAHHLTKAVVETKNFPIQNPGCVVNLPDYNKWIMEGAK